MRKTGIVLVGLGAFLVVLALMVRFYAYPQLAVAPENPDSVTNLTAEDATIFDTATLSEITTDLAVTSLTVGDAEAQAEAPDGVVTWVNSSSTTRSDGTILSRGKEMAPTDDVSGEAVNCCGSFEEVAEGEEEAVEREGLVYKFPFNTQKQDYDFWDADTRQAYPATYTGTDDLNGVETYTFVQEVPRTQTGTIELPADLLGEEGEDNLVADMMYSNTRTFWIEPNTGAVLDRTEELNNSIAYDGTDRITTTSATVHFTEEQVKQGTDDYGPLATQLGLLRTTAPLVLGILGILLLVAGLFVTRRKPSSSEPATRKADTTPQQPAPTA